MKPRISKEALTSRVQKMIDYRTEFMSDIDNIHVKLQPGNSKTGANCYTVSLIPVADCQNCSACKGDCYDINNVCWMSTVQKDRARNSAIHMHDPKRYWEEIESEIRRLYVSALRINVGGDLLYNDLIYLSKIAQRNPKCEFLFFTKNYDSINKFLSEHSFPSNVHPMWSRWPGMKSDNRYHVPEAHVLYEDGSTTAPEYGAVYCNGNCSECFWYSSGCVGLKSGESVMFKIH